MTANQPALPFRNDTILGVCEALGQDFGIHPNLLRILFAGAFYFSPTLVTGTYLGLGLLVALSRWLAPAAKPVDATTVAVEAADQDDTDLRLAA